MPKLTSNEQTELLDCPGVLMRIAVVNADGAPSALTTAIRISTPGQSNSSVCSLLVSLGIRGTLHHSNSPAT